MEKLRLRRLYGIRLHIGILVLFVLFLSSIPMLAQGADFFGQTTTIMRARSYNDKNYYPAYEYLSFALTDLWDGQISLYAGGWGRFDLGEKSTDEYHAGDLQYAYVTYRAPNNNLLVGLGRQFITDGGVSEIMDGLYLRSDLPLGFGVGAFVGMPVVEEPDDDGGDFIFGGRVSQASRKYYTIGLSYLDVRQGGEFYRQEETLDVWIHPFKQIDLVGMSAYNSVTDGWMEHDYVLTYIPMDSLSFDASLTQINYKDYFFHMTTNVFDLISLSNPTGYINPDEEMLSIGGGISYSLLEWLTLGIEYKNYQYKIDGNANNYGGKVTVSPFTDFIAGASVHRMYGDSKDIRYWAYRVFASKKISNFTMTLDLLDVIFDSSINGVKNSYIIAAAAAYSITSNLEIGGSVDYSQSPEFDSEVTGLLKLTYTFDCQLAESGRTK